MAWSDAARDAAAEVRRRHGAIRLGKWDARKGKGIVYPERGSFSRSTVAHTVKQFRALARGTLSAVDKKTMGPVVKPPKKERLAGARGAVLLNHYAASGFRDWR